MPKRKQAAENAPQRRHGHVVLSIAVAAALVRKWITADEAQRLLELASHLDRVYEALQRDRR